jgi:hypothetical protein
MRNTPSRAALRIFNTGVAWEDPGIGVWIILKVQIVLPLDTAGIGVTQSVREERSLAIATKIDSL